MWETIWPYIAAIVPTLVMATLFYLLMKSILEADRRERLAQSQWEANAATRSPDSVRGMDATDNVGVTKRNPWEDNSDGTTSADSARRRS